MKPNQLLELNKLSGMLITKPENVRYLSGFVGSFGQLLITKKKQFLITDPRYSEQAKKMCFKNIEIINIKDIFETLENLINKNKIKSLGFEDKDFTYYKFRNFKKHIKGAALKPLGNKIDEMRLIKSSQEIELIKKSQIINEKTLHEILKLLKEGVTETQIANKILMIGKELGADTTSFDPIVAFGANSSSPHYMPTNTKLKKSEIVLIDMGMKFKGYCSDMSRTFLPKNASNEMKNHYNAVLLAQEKGIKEIKPKMTGSFIDKLIREPLAKLKFDQFFTHSSGHGIGLEIHESPSLSSKIKHKDRTMQIEENMVITVEPGLYFEGKYGIRIEDMIVVKKAGNLNLTNFPK